MNLLQKLKAFLGFDRGARRRAEPEVTVERRPSTESEDAVKGTDETPRAPQSTGSGETDDEVSAAGGTEPTDNDEPPSTDASEDVVNITGIGPTYGERLAGAGIETVTDLAGADAETVAEAAETSQSRARDWIEQARDR